MDCENNSLGSCRAMFCQPPPLADLQPDVDAAEVEGPPLDQIIREALSGSNLHCHSHLGFEDKLEGPRTALESMMWPMQIWQSLEVQGLKFSETDFGVKARQSLFKGLVLTTDYSGIGCPEEAFDKVLLAAKIVAEEKGEEGPVSNSQFRCLRAGDKEGHCRDILLNHGGCFQPECVHGDILDRCAGKSKQRMLEIQKQGLKAVQEEVNRRLCPCWDFQSWQDVQIHAEHCQRKTRETPSPLRCA